MPLHPEFERPRWGHFRREPLLVLEGVDGNSHTVPAALSRYLPAFQKEGVRFLYERLTSETGGGALLADQEVNNYVITHIMRH